MNYRNLNFENSKLHFTLGASLTRRVLYLTVRIGVAKLRRIQGCSGVGTRGAAFPHLFVVVTRSHTIQH